MLSLSRGRQKGQTIEKKATIRKRKEKSHREGKHFIATSKSLGACFHHNSEDEKNCLDLRYSSFFLFFSRKVLRITDGIEDLGGFNWELVACLSLAWILTYLSIVKGVKTTGKVSNFNFGWKHNDYNNNDNEINVG